MQHAFGERPLDIDGFAIERFNAFDGFSQIIDLPGIQTWDTCASAAFFADTLFDYCTRIYMNIDMFM